MFPQGDRRRTVRPHRAEGLVHREGRRSFDPSGTGSCGLHARARRSAQGSQGECNV